MVVLIFSSAQDSDVTAMKNAKLNGDWPDAIITVPAIHHFDDDARIVIMDDCCVGS